ncbi:nucleoside triphosphate pyrophosphatase [Leptospira santarosai]|uniref:dTTP/UTP pyrophosphatase n=2 Tax=Leptospira santarosai TaxID=28183 RepID=A0A0E2BI85_9LEPT|nr:nucleoside triphosphate pyrophosphatase [Leptospira santarosai]EMO57626.1 septum formation protein Maf [Leptospira santarosai str. CBC1416]EKO34899.1 septum formation protein Maf [Leptospira santarosai str. MOR084]EMJ49299.1 septum formation protein Maf [Leptospira santarosai str. HAI1349]EMO21943.1 septum formation protein Maf [Leptospira santarosai str. HAI134]EMP03606.1 septum formation protein Maf [Leptospira santarosai str. HAI1380]
MIVLRSKSPRRKQVLESLNLDFRVEPEEIDESSLENEYPLEYLERICLSKLGTRSKDEFLISCDTIVVQENSILQKPESFSEAMEMLQRLSGKTHRVASGIGIYYKGFERFAFEFSQVHFRPWNQEQIREYIEKYSPFDKAGSYGVQDKGGPVQSFEGSYTNILGFPIRTFFQYHEFWKKYLKNTFIK